MGSVRWRMLSFLVFLCGSVSAQRVGDYQSGGVVDLSLVTNWQVWNGAAWNVASIPPGGNLATGQTVTILPGHDWNNASSSTIPEGVVLINQGTTGTFTTSALNKINLNGTYVHYTISSVSTILQGMTIHPGSNFIYRGSSLLTPAVSFSNRTYYNLTIESLSGNLSVNLAGFSGGSNPLTVNGSFTVGENVSLHQNTFTGLLNFNSDLFISGTLNVNSFTVAAGKKLTVGPTGVIQIPAGETVTVNGDAEMGTGKFSGPGNLILNGILKTSHADGLTASGTFQHSGTTTLSDTSRIEFNSTGMQAIDATIPLKNLTISNGSKSLAATLVVSGNLILNSTLVLDNHNISIGGTITGHSAAYVKTSGDGKLIMKNITGSRLLAIGNSTYNPLVISNGDGLDWSVRVIDSVQPAVGFANSSKFIQRTWDISPSGTSSGADISFQYDDADPNQKGSFFLTNEQVQVWNYHSGNWQTASLALTPSGNTSGGVRSVSLTAQNRFSSFAIANLGTALPITFRGFSATADNRVVKLLFTNETETDVMHYEIERVENGSFKTVQKVQPLRNDGSSVSYMVKDYPPQFTEVTYRIRALGTTGVSEYSNVVRVNLDKAQDIYIVRQGDQLYWRAPVSPGPFEVIVYSFSGTISFYQKQVHKHGEASGSILMRTNGNYILIIKGKENLIRNFSWY